MAQRLTEKEIERIIDDFQCYPHGTIEIDFDFDPETNVLTASHLALDSRNEEYFTYDGIAPDAYPVPLRFSRTLGSWELSSEGRFVFAMLDMVITAAAHEVLEWTRYKGQVIHDPHVDGEPWITVPHVDPEIDMSKFKETAR